MATAPTPHSAPAILVTRSDQVVRVTLKPGKALLVMVRGHSPRVGLAEPGAYDLSLTGGHLEAIEFPAALVLVRAAHIPAFLALPAAEAGKMIDALLASRVLH